MEDLCLSKADIHGDGEQLAEQYTALSEKNDLKKQRHSDAMGIYQTPKQRRDKRHR